MKNEDTEGYSFTDYGLEELEKLLKDKGNPTIKVGILGDKNARPGDNTNAEIGQRHEFGLDGMERRSFIRMPLIEKMQEAFDNSGALDNDAVKKMFKGGFMNWFKKIGVLAEGVIADSFDTGGFGKWKSSEMKYKKNKQTLIETQQLRNSITSTVEEHNG